MAGSHKAKPDRCNCVTADSLQYSAAAVKHLSYRPKVARWVALWHNLPSGYAVILPPLTNARAVDILKGRECVFIVGEDIIGYVRNC